jgi:hypothetical protein
MEGRAGRAPAAVGLAVVVVAVIGLTYLHWKGLTSPPVPPPRSPAARQPSIVQASFVSANLGWW